MRFQLVLFDKLRNQYLDDYFPIDVATAEAVVSRNRERCHTDSSHVSGYWRPKFKDSHIAGSAAKIEHHESAGGGHPRKDVLAVGECVVDERSNRFVQQGTISQINAGELRGIDRVPPLGSLERRWHCHHCRVRWRAVVLRRGIDEEPQQMAADVLGGSIASLGSVVSPANAHVVLAIPEYVSVQLQVEVNGKGTQVLGPRPNIEFLLMQGQDRWNQRMELRPHTRRLFDIETTRNWWVGCFRCHVNLSHRRVGRAEIDSDHSHGSSRLGNLNLGRSRKRRRTHVLPLGPRRTGGESARDRTIILAKPYVLRHQGLSFGWEASADLPL